MPWDMNNIIAAATPKRTTAITKGWADNKPILVAVEADAHKMAKDIPATGHV
jgi:hypothetical protein